MLGLLGLLVLSAKTVSQYVKENIGFQVYLKDDATAADITAFQNVMSSKPYVKSSQFISKDQALAIYKEEVGEDFIQYTGYNPLPASLDLRLNAGYTNNDSINWIKEQIMANKPVKEFVYKENFISVINENVSRISFFFLIFIGLLMAVSIALINNTIRLAIYSKRFIVRTMQLVGATQRFISKPLIIQSFTNGIYAALIANLLLAGIVYLIKSELPDLWSIFDLQLFLFLFGLVLAFGISISWVSTKFAVRKYLRLTTDKLYY
jgi:cell division transport system permease protein